jgi:twitching motility protein PilT
VTRSPRDQSSSPAPAHAFGAANLPSSGPEQSFGASNLPPPTRAAAPSLPPALRELVLEASRKRASDLHLAPGRPACARVLGQLVPLRGEALSPAAVEALVMPLLDGRGHRQLDTVGYSDFAFEMPGGGRLRSNISKCQGGVRGTFRIAREQPPTLDELGLPKELAKVISHHQGLVVIAGPSGHGKTTTLAALVDLVNATSAFHIITVEDPIEIVYRRKLAVVSQREVGPHTRSFAAALKGSLREDPDVIVIGELRDRETVEIALTAAETGHLVLATMSTPSAAKTIDRLVDMFPPDDQSQVRASIAGALRAIVAQRLLPSAQGDGVVAAVELLTGVLPLANMIRDDKLFQLPSLMQRGRAFGMIRLDDSLAELVRANKLTTEAALAASDNRKELATRLQQGTAAVPVMRKP